MNDPNILFCFLLLFGYAESYFPRHVESSSLTRGWTQAPYTGRAVLTTGSTEKSPHIFNIYSSLKKNCLLLKWYRCKPYFLNLVILKL